MVLTALCLTIASLPFTRRYGAVPFYVLLVTTLILWFWKGDGKRVWSKGFSTPLTTPILIFTGIGFVSILSGHLYGGDYLLRAFDQFFKNWLTPFFLFYLVYNVARERKAIRILALTIVFVITVIAARVSVEYFFDRDRMGGVMDDPNVLAAFLNAYLFLPLGFFLTQTRKRLSWLFFLSFLVDFRGLMVTLSRGGYLAFATGLHAMIFFRNKFVFLALIIGTAVVLMNPILLPAGVRYRIGETLERPLAGTATVDSVKDSLDPNSRYRIEIWKGAVAMIRQNPLLGVGYNLFESKIQHYWPELEAMDTHNTYLLIASEMGIPALFIFLLMVFLVMGKALSLYRITQDSLSKALSLGFLAGIFALLISHFFTNELDAPEVSGYFWVLAAMIYRLRALENG